MNNYELIHLNTARNALRYIIKAFQIKEIYLPYYICPSIRIAVLKENIKVNFYNININFEPVCNFPKNAYIVYPNYFGVCTNIVKKLALKYENLIVDNAHAFFAKPSGIASFNSARKFFPMLKNGSFLYTQKTLSVSLIQDNYKYEYEKLTYENLCKNEARLDLEDIKSMSDSTYQYILNINIEAEKDKYLEHFNKYNDLFAKKNKLKISLDGKDIPFKYPFLADSVEEADMLACELEKQNITVFRYWNNMPESFVEKVFYTRLIAI